MAPSSFFCGAYEIEFIDKQQKKGQNTRRHLCMHTDILMQNEWHIHGADIFNTDDDGVAAIVSEDVPSAYSVHSWGSLILSLF